VVYANLMSGICLKQVYVMLSIGISTFSVEQQLFELLLRCQNNPFDNGIVDEGHNLPEWFIIRLKRVVPF